MPNKKQNDRKVPNLRFREFQEEWVENQLGNLLEFKNGINAAKEQYGKGVPFINVLDILKNDFIVRENIMGKVDVDNNTVEKFSVTYGDILFQRSSETREAVGTANVYLDKEYPATFGGFVIRGKKIGEYDPIFFNKLLQTNSARDSITSKSGGSTRYNIGQEILSSIRLYFPSLIEQDKISSFLSLVDSRINTQSKIIEVLKYQIQVLQRRLLKQELRFKDENGKFFAAWEKKSGGELFDSISDKRHNSNLPILAITQDKGAIPRDLIDFDISVTDKSVAGYKVVKAGDFIISLRSFQGGLEYSDYNGICSPAYVILRNKIEIEKRFYKYYFKSADYIRLLNQKLEGIRDGKMISYNYFSEIPLWFPSLNEQKRIASFLSDIDSKIELETQFLKNLQEQKKYLLQNLFV